MDKDTYLKAIELSRQINLLEKDLAEIEKKGSHFISIHSFGNYYDHELVDIISKHSTEIIEDIADFIQKQLNQVQSEFDNL